MSIVEFLKGLQPALLGVGASHPNLEKKKTTFRFS